MLISVDMREAGNYIVLYHDTLRTNCNVKQNVYHLTNQSPIFLSEITNPSCYKRYEAEKLILLSGTKNIYLWKKKPLIVIITLSQYIYWKW